MTRLRLSAASAILLVCSAVASSAEHSGKASSAAATSTSTEQYDRKRRPLRRRTETTSPSDGAGDADYIPALIDEEVSTSTPNAAATPNADTEEVPFTIEKMQLDETPSSATITGKVYHDYNRNRQHDDNDDEFPLSGVLVRLYSCESGSRVGTTRTNDNGQYSFTISSQYLPNQNSSRKGCYYIQYNVNNSVLDNAEFTTPRNGETNDIYISVGDKVTGVDAGVYEQTPEPSPELKTLTPTTDTPGPTPAPYYYIYNTPVPTPSGEDGFRYTRSPAGGWGSDFGNNDEEGGGDWGGEFTGGAWGVDVDYVTTEPPPLDLPLPGFDGVDMSGGSSSGDGSGAPPDDVPGSAPGELPLPVPDSVETPQQTPQQTPVSTPVVEAPSPVAVVSGQELGSEGVVGELNNEPDAEQDANTGDPGDDQQQDSVGQEQPNLNPENIEQPIVDSTEPVEQGSGGNLEKQELPNDGTDTTTSPVEEESNILLLKSTIQIQLDNLGSTMDEPSQALFDQVCTEFLADQLQFATPPITDVDCEVINQEVLTAKRSLIRRMLADGDSLLVDAQVSGEVEKTKSVQKVEDVKFDQLLVGTFNVQGYLFVDALVEAESELLSEGGQGGNETALTVSYFQEVGDVRGIQLVSSIPDNEVDQGDDPESSDPNSSKELIAGIAVAAVAFIAILLLCVCRSRKRRKRAQQSAAATKQSTNAKRRRSSKAQSTSTSKSRKIPSPTSVLSASRTPAKSPPQTSPISPYSPTSPGDLVITQTNSTIISSPGSPTSYVRQNTGGDDVEIGLSQLPPPPPYDDAPGPPPLPPKQRVRVQRDVMAPAGKLGILVANTTSYGPAIHTIKPNSPMEGLVYVNDIIVAVNDVDTRNMTADDITNIMRNTVGDERKITVLSKHQ